MTVAAPPLDLHPEVAAARAQGRPVVALESTIIAHGMPWPHNLHTGQALEAEIRRHGEAESMYRRAIAILEAVTTGTSRELTLVLENLARTLEAQGKITEALPVRDRLSSTRQ